jgi:hypothetical protein
MNELMQQIIKSFYKFFKMNNQNIDEMLYNETFNLNTHYSFFENITFSSKFISEIFDAITLLIINNQKEEKDYEILYEREIEYIWDD